MSSSVVIWSAGLLIDPIAGPMADLLEAALLAVRLAGRLALSMAASHLRLLIFELAVAFGIPPELDKARLICDRYQVD